MIFGRRLPYITIGFAVLVSATLVCAAPKPTARAAAGSALLSHHWDLVAWSAGQVPEGKRLRLDFGNGRFSTSTMCNGAGGVFRVSGRTIRFGTGKGQFVSTEMACLEPAMSAERAYLTSLAAVRTWRIADDRLILGTAKGETLTYRAVHKPAADAPRKFIYVSAEIRPCMGIGPMTCLQVREKEGDPWQLHYGKIVDFEPQPGIEYRLRIIEERIARRPADGSPIWWTLDQIIEQRLVK